MTARSVAAVVPSGAPLAGAPPAGARLPRCAPASIARGDAMGGSAAPVTRWLLVEQPGPWGRDALLQSRIDHDVATAIAARASGAGMRVMLVRRPGRGASSMHRRWAVVDSRPGREAVWWSRYGDHAELLDAPWDGSAGERADGLTYLVCAHGRHDACCAIRGRPVAAALAAVRPEATWECSHTGGDRFAANVVVLPHGLVLGHVPAAAVPDLVGTLDAGLVDPTWLRGRTAFPAPVQAAQHHARLALGELGVDALAPLSADEEGTGTWRVRLAAARGPVEVVLRTRLSEPVPRVTCASTQPQRVRVFDLVSLAG